MNFKVAPGWITPDRQKVPCFGGWREVATTDVSVINGWVQQLGNNISHWLIPTGTINNILVLDIDVKSHGWQTIKDNNLFIPDTLSQQTMSGGTHFIFKYPNDGFQYGQKVGFLPGLDIRAEGGYIFNYDPNLFTSTKPILDAPLWILEAAKKVESVINKENVLYLSDSMALATLADCCENIRNAPQGHSNDILNVEAYRGGQLLVNSDLPRDKIEAELMAAALARGKPEREARATIRSGLEGGIKNPLSCPFGKPTPPPAGTPPAPPENVRWTPRYLTYEDLMNKSKLKKPQLFKDWSTEDFHITTADGGTGKTTLALLSAVCLALGERFLGFECIAPGKTLYITGEDTEAKLGAIIGAILTQLGIKDDKEKVDKVLQSIIIKKDADLCLITKDRQGFIRPNRDAVEKIMQAVDDHHPKYIVLDPIASLWGSESSLNDMSLAVAKLCSEISERAHACVEALNHMGKSSSQTKDMTQFAGRGGSALPSHSRVSRVLRTLDPAEFKEKTGRDLLEGQTALYCNINKFSDGSPLYNKPFVIVRTGFLFERVMNISLKVEDELSDTERVYGFIRKSRNENKYPTDAVIVGHFQKCGDPLSKPRVMTALKMIAWEGHMGEKIQWIDNPDIGIKDKAVILVSERTGEEL